MTLHQRSSHSAVSDPSSTGPSTPAVAWTRVCRCEEIVPDTGVCARVAGQQVAVFRLADGSVHAIGNYDPNGRAAVLSRGLTGSLGGRLVVASPLYKHHFDLRTGECLEIPANSVPAYPTRVEDGVVWVQTQAVPAALDR
ncbi:nitrite reductase small subunit NirD [Chitinasiproducens palmae]|uniref:Assimilatory nitrite reductase (NAD(P)H) small subunit n=1 Tax=Chitinasiproducens palmae TaxID=1770053 RepID=A0A1H2PRP6_9BURK|nr:nitrite reductase small subunit NirD [Chitinasiproducens palmae]SDV48771.1 assimilatory nitrite reductase (NAD(P)H) small subunit [Chitinasiproducens palmae]